MLSKFYPLIEKYSFIAGLVLTLSLLWPLFYAPYFTMHDDVQTIRLYEMNKCFEDRQIPCRWVPDLGGEYGYPLFNYYAPLPYYSGEIVYLLTHNLIFSAKFMFGLAFVGSYIFMYLAARKLWGGVGGLLSGVFYSFAPYHSVDFYVRGAMGELWGLLFFPAIFWALFRLRERPTLRNFLLLSIFSAGLVTSHNLSAMIFMPTVFVSMIAFFILDRNRKFLFFTIAALVFGVMLSCFYWLPALSEKPLAHVETTVEGYFSHTEHFKGLKRLFIDRDWGYGASIRVVPGGPPDGLSFQIGVVHVGGWLLALLLAWKMRKKKREVSLMLGLFTLFSLGSVFMIHPRSEFVWHLLYPLQYLQFPWRFLEIIIFFVSLSVGSVVLFEINLRSKRLLLLGLICLVVILNFGYFRPDKFLYESDKDLLHGATWDMLIKRSIFDYLPIYAEAPPAELATVRYQILTGDTSIKNFKEGSDWFTFDANTKTHSIIRVSQYYFPDWIIKVDNQPVNIDYSNSLGLMTFILGVGSHQIDGKLHDTPIRALSNFISLVSILGFGFLTLLSINTIKAWFKYYLRVLKK